MRDRGRHVLVNLVGDGRVEVRREEEAEEVVERGQRGCGGPADEAGDPAGGAAAGERGEDAVGLGRVLALDVGEEAAEAVVAVRGPGGGVGGADVGGRVRVRGPELAGEAHAVPVGVAAHPSSWRAPESSPPAAGTRATAENEMPPAGRSSLCLCLDSARL